MRFLSVAERELRAAARQKKTYRLRWIVATGAFALLLWLGWAFDAFANRLAGPRVFQVCSVILFLVCLLIGSADTADCLSREKREGTLGLLFLTNLNSAEIVAGKLCANGLALIYPLLATFPILGLPVLIGGITFGEFWRTVLALANASFFAMAAGFTASALCVRQVPAVAMAIGLALLFGMGSSGVAVLIRHWGCPASVANTIAAFCPLRSLTAAGNNPPLLADYWSSLAAVAGMSWTWLALVAWRVGRTWRDRTTGGGGWRGSGLRQRIRKRGSGARVAFRRRLIEINPFFWLAGRQRVSAPIFMLLTVGLICITVGITAPYFSRVIRAGAASPMVGQIFAWLWTGMAIHALVLYYAATVASQRLAEDKQTGALELILSSPTTERFIARGLWLAYARRMLFPVLMAVLVHLFFIWHCATMAVLDPPGKLPPRITPWQLFWLALFDQPLNGIYPDWEFVLMFRILLLALVGLAASWLMLGWVARWLGLRMKHAGFAPIAAVFLALAPPTVMFSLVCYLSDRWNLTRVAEREFVPMMMWIGFGIWMGNCLILSAWAAVRLRRDFRTTVTSRFESPPQRRPWILRWRMLLRFAAAAAGVALALVLTVLLFHGHQYWQSKRRWTAFQTELKQRGESLDLSAVMPAPVPATQNFARMPVFQNLLSQKPATNSAVQLLDRSPDNSARQLPGNKSLTPWTKQDFADLDQPLKWIIPEFSAGAVKDRRRSASAVSDGLKPIQDDMAAVVLAAHLPFFQVTTNRDPAAVLQWNSRELVTLERLHFVFQLRASALLALSRETEAGEDVLTSLRLAQLARQSPDVNSTFRVQSLLVSSLQPLWEGLAEHRWSEPQLAAFQKELARFDLLSDHTNAIHRIVLAYVETWRASSEAMEQPASAPQAGSVNFRHRESAWQPRTLSYDNCRQLYRAGQNAMARVDAAAGRLSDEVNWGDLRGLPLDGNTSWMFQQGQWWGGTPMLVSFAQTAANQAMIACALERFRLVHGEYPETLDQLLTAGLEKIPRDISRGRPMFYQRDDKDSYVLRGAGPNGVIDHGTVPSDDWLWSFTAPPTNAPPVAANPRK